MITCEVLTLTEKGRLNSPPGSAECKNAIVPEAVVPDALCDSKTTRTLHDVPKALKLPAYLVLGLQNLSKSSFCCARSDRCGGGEGTADAGCGCGARLTGTGCGSGGATTGTGRGGGGGA